MEKKDEEYNKRIVGWVSGNLLSGKFLVIPASIYDLVVEECRKYGMPEKAIKQLYKSENLKSK